MREQINGPMASSWTPPASKAYGRRKNYEKKRTKRFDGWQSKQSLRVEIKPLAALQHATKNNIKHNYSVCSQVLEFHKIHCSSWRIRFFSFHHCSILFSSLFLITLLVLLRFSSLLSRPQGKPSPATQEKGLLRLLAKAPGWQTMNPSNTIQKCHETEDMTSRRRAMEWTWVVETESQSFRIIHIHVSIVCSKLLAVV